MTTSTPTTATIPVIYPDSQEYPATEPISVVAERPPWRHTFIALSVPNFRIWTSGNLVAMTATWMQKIAQDWLVLELTGSATKVGITVALQFAPMLMFGLFGGVIVDRFSKRTLMMITQSCFALLSLGLAVLTLTGDVTAYMVWGIAFLTGLVTVIDNPARQVIVTELVGQKNLRNAISINSSVFQLGGMIGPAIAGALLLAVGAGWAFLVNGLACALVVFMLTRLRTSQMTRQAPSPREPGQLRAGLRYAWAKPTIIWPVFLIAVFAVFGLTMPVILASYADTVFKVGAGGYGLFNSMIAVGALTGALLSTRRANIRLRTVVIGVGLTGVLQAFASFMPSVAPFATVLIAVGMSSLLMQTASNSLVQMSSNIAVRGRVMSLYVLVLLGGQAVGGPLMGWLVSTFGVHFGMLVSGGMPALAAAFAGVMLARRGHLTVHLRMRHHVPLPTIEHRLV
ncbi:MFS transporter [Frondihabitans australicus]|uniref:Putative MFS family arabinose efflux permease n=1 Tax=Frondihabitans australicus TaxID=386892 RepID=A0A495IFC6_9MICO|nr:MFS transporter [Frondihabitans australicus]RKR74360.1 putative MFS family arabinose efflux permease [Frondihabitans australicus]